MRLRVTDKEKEKETIEKGSSSPTPDKGRAASPSVSIEKVVLPSKRRKTGIKGRRI